MLRNNMVKETRRQNSEDNVYKPAYNLQANDAKNCESCKSFDYSKIIPEYLGRMDRDGRKIYDAICGGELTKDQYKFFQHSNGNIYLIGVQKYLAGYSVVNITEGGTVFRKYDKLRVPGSFVYEDFIWDTVNYCDSKYNILSVTGIHFGVKQATVHYNISDMNNFPHSGKRI